MSLILEALKKSEAERGRAQAPTPAAAGNGRGPSRWFGLALMVLAAGVAIIGIYFWVETRSGAGDAAAERPVALPAQEAAEVEVPPAPGTGEQARQPAPQGSEATDLAGPDTAAAQAAGQRAPAVSSQPQTSEAQGEPTRVESAPPAAPATVELAAPERSAAVDRPPPTATAGAPASRYPPIETMPDLEARSLIGEMKINVHVYADDPGRRFVLVDLKRQTEGADLADGIRIAEIIPEGVVVDVGGKLYFWRSR